MLGASDSLSNRKFWAGVSLVLVLLGGIALRAKLVDYNLPVAANVDERSDLGILRNLERTHLDPGIYHYPSFYFYLTSLLPASSEDHGRLLKQGRMLNVGFSVLLALACFVLAKRLSASWVAGVLATSFALFSPILIESGSYIITDVLVAGLAVGSLFYTGRFVEGGRKRDWLLSVVLTGLAVATKYSAVFLLPLFVLAEYMRPRASEKVVSTWGFLDRRIENRTFVILLAALGGGLLSAAAFFPTEGLLALVSERQRPNSTIDAEDLAFLQGIRMALAMLGAGLGLAAFVFRLRPRLSETFLCMRPLFGLGGIALVLAICSPYSLIAWRASLFQFGYELKANQFGGTSSSWAAYFHILADRESVLILGLSVLGLFCVWRNSRRALPITLYLLLGFVSIGTSTRSASRYLTPVLPVLFVLAATGLVRAATRLSLHTRSPGKGLLLVGLFLIGVSTELHPKLVREIERRTGTDEMHESYQVLMAHPGLRRLLWSGFTPTIELELGLDGLRVVRVSSSWLHGNGEIPAVERGDALLLDRASHERFQRNEAWELTWSTDQGYGQYLYLPRGREG